MSLVRKFCLDRRLPRHELVSNLQRIYDDVSLDGRVERMDIHFLCSPIVHVVYKPKKEDRYVVEFDFE